MQASSLDTARAIGQHVPDLAPRSTAETLKLRPFCAERAVLYFYPATGVPGRDPALDPAPRWDEIPGAAGGLDGRRLLHTGAAKRH